MRYLTVEYGSDRFRGELLEGPDKRVVKTVVMPAVECYNRKTGERLLGIYNIKGASEDIDLKYPISEGVIVDWDCFRVLIEKFLSELLSVSDFRNLREDYHMQIALPKGPRNEYQLIRQLIQSYSVHLTAGFLNIGTAVSKAVDWDEGIIIHIDSDYTQVTRVRFDGTIDSRKIGIGIDTLCQYMLMLLAGRKDCEMNMEEIRELIGSVCYVSKDFETDLEGTEEGTINVEKEYTVPSRKVKVLLGNERFRCPEVFFNPAVIGLDDSFSLPQAIMEVAFPHPPLRIVIAFSGRITEIPGLGDRLRTELVNEIEKRKEKMIFNTQYKRQCFENLSKNIRVDFPNDPEDLVQRGLRKFIQRYGV